MDKPAGVSFSDLANLIKLHADRQRIIASNIANVDTPGYKAKDIDFQAVLNNEVTGLTVSHDKHIPVNDTSGPIERKTQDIWGDGNNVELDMEVAKMTENALMHQFYIRALSGRITKFKTALKRS